MIPTLSRSIRSVPRPAEWPRAQDDTRLLAAATAAVNDV